MKMIRILSLTALCALAFVACKKDDDVTKTEMLAGGKWTLTSLTVSPAIVIGGTSFTDLFSTYPACSKDDFQTFATDGTYTYDEGATKCDPSDVQTDTGTWSFNTAETQLTLNGTGYSDVWEIVNLSATEMTSKYTFVEGGVTYTATGKLVKK